MINVDITASHFEHQENQSENINHRKTNSINNDEINSKSPYEWTCDEVIKWINTTSFANKRKKFKKANINGRKLFDLDRVSLQNDVKIFDAKSRRGILLSIQKLKHKWRDLQKHKTQKWAKSHSNAPRSNKKNSPVENIQTQTERIYIQIRRNKNIFNDISNYSIQHILNFYELTNANKQSLSSIISTNDMDLIDCLFDDKKTVFIFIIQHNTQPKKHIYLMTKNVKTWTAQNVFIYFSKINNGKYNSFAKQLKKKQINGARLLKYNRKTLRDDFTNYTDSLLRKHIFDEIRKLSDTDSISSAPVRKTYHNYIKPTQSDIEKQRIQRQELKKLGPRDIGKNKHYKQITYSLNENDLDTSFLNEHICASAQYQNFRKRKELNPILPNETVDEIGTNKHYKQITYVLTENDLTGGFLNERFHPLSKDSKFQKRKQKNPLAQKETVQQIGSNKHYIQITYELTENDLKGGFLNERVHPLSKDSKFQKRKQQMPIIHNLTVDEIGVNDHFKGISYEMRNSEVMGTFLNENIHPLAKDSNFQKRKQENPLSLKQSVSDICVHDDFEGINYKMRDSEIMGTFLTERIHPSSKNDKFQQRKQQNPLAQQETVQKIGNNKHYIQITYELTESDLTGGFLQEKINTVSKDETFQQRKKQNPLAQKETVQQIGSNKHYIQISYQLRKSEVIGPFLNENVHPVSRDSNFQKRKEMNPVIRNETLSEIGTNEHYKSISYVLMSDSEMKSEAFPEKQWYESTKICDDTGLSWLLRNLPSHKLKIMDQMPLPTGAQTKIAWLRKLRDLIADELAGCSKKNSKKNIAYSDLLKKQLSEVNGMLMKLRNK